MSEFMTCYKNITRETDKMRFSVKFVDIEIQKTGVI